MNTSLAQLQHWLFALQRGDNFAGCGGLSFKLTINPIVGVYRSITRISYHKGGHLWKHPTLQKKGLISYSTSIFGTWKCWWNNQRINSTSSKCKSLHTSSKLWKYSGYVMENSPGSTSVQRSIFISISWSISMWDTTSPNFPEIRGRLRVAILSVFWKKTKKLLATWMCIRV